MKTALDQVQLKLSAKMALNKFQDVKLLGSMDIVEQRENLILSQIKETTERVELYRPMMEVMATKEVLVPDYMLAQDGDVIFNHNISQIYDILNVSSVATDPVRLKICRNLLRGLVKTTITVFKNKLKYKHNK